MSDCIFCKIVSGDIPSDKVYEDDLAIGFRDLNPQAPHHYLLIPKQHIATINDVDQSNEAIMGRLYSAAAKLAKELGFDDAGYRAILPEGIDPEDPKRTSLFYQRPDQFVAREIVLLLPKKR